MLGSLMRGAKDGALAISMKAFLNDKLGLYGEVVECAVDTKSNRVTLKAHLKGESQTVTASIERYELEREGEDSYIVLKKFSSSREWLTLMLQRFFTDKRYKLPGAVTKLL
ncbi:MAG: hypothetical protein Q8Q73_14235 [Stagnimonas sp.]|nr:hypothetical protein [Stagnimonas sp.]